nr:hypothetical protein [Tanacetum cinerariifolium]
HTPTSSDPTPVLPLTNKEFKASEPSDTRITSSHFKAPLDSTTPLSPDHPLTHTSPTHTLSRPLYYHRTARMAVRTQPTLSSGFSTRLTEIAPVDVTVGSPVSQPPSMSNLNSRKSRLGYGAARCCALEIAEEIKPSTFEIGHSSRSAQVVDETPTPRIPARTTWIDPEDGTIYLDIKINPLSCAPVQTSASPEWSFVSLPVSPVSLTIPSPVPLPATTPVATMVVDEDEFIEI